MFWPFKKYFLNFIFFLFQINFFINSDYFDLLIRHRNNYNMSRATQSASSAAIDQGQQKQLRVQGLATISMVHKR
jgi:hypothetical protein